VSPHLTSSRANTIALPNALEPPRLALVRSKTGSSPVVQAET
jgi:hypothetical protein